MEIQLDTIPQRNGEKKSSFSFSKRQQIHHIFNIYSFALRKQALGKLIMSFVWRECLLIFVLFELCVCVYVSVYIQLSHKPIFSLKYVWSGE